MASNMNTTTQDQVQVSERNPEGLPETIVETVDYRSYPGHDPERVDVEVIHQLHLDQGHAGVLDGAAAVVAKTIQSAKDAISGTGTTTTSQPKSQGQTK